MQQSNWGELSEKLHEIMGLSSAAAVLSWDQAVFLPTLATDARAEALSAVARAVHQRQTDPKLGALIDSLSKEDGDAKSQALLRIAQRDYELATKVPESFQADLSKHLGLSFGAWVAAKSENNFKKMIPILEKTVDLSRRYAGFFKYAHVADPLINRSDYGISAEWLKSFFASLRPALVQLADQVTARGQGPDTCLRKEFTQSEQLEFGLSVAKQIGFDFSRGRQDLAPHPFMTRFSGNDVRITTRVLGNHFGEALFSTIHEAGHGMYEQGINLAHDGTPLGSGTSSGVHESQSRLWENVVGRSRPFWQFFYPQAQKKFPTQLGNVSLDEFYHAINRVERSLIRTDADELTYNLHVMIRVDLEIALLEGRLTVKDLPEAWNEAYRTNLGVVPKNDSEGVMQDIHWYCDMVGGSFQGYTIGNVLAAQFYGAAKRAHPTLESDFIKGDFSALKAWLNKNVHSFGRELDTHELVQSATGKAIDVTDYLEYLHQKYQ